MARMYPDDIEDYREATEGEKRVFRFLREAARPDADFICWYEPPIGSAGKEPDFLLFGKRLGFLVLEVKDWAAWQIISFNPHQFTVRISGKPEKKTNPDKQAKGYINTLKERLSKVPEFLSDDPRFRGHPRIPIGRIVVFPNISRSEYTDSKFKWLIEAERVLLKEDLEATGEFLCDTSGKRFQARISKVMPFAFKGFIQEDIDRLCSILWPEGKIDLPVRLGPGKARFQEEVLALDEAQSRLAWRIGSGHQVIKGPPGSGKTLVLVHRCCQLYRYRPGAKRILLVCYNIALVSYLRRLLQEKGILLGEGGVQVLHFYELCSRILGEKIHYENEENDYYNLITDKALNKVNRGERRIRPFDAILVDEAQDFNNGMLKTISGLLAPKGDFIIALDPLQDLYRRKASWRSLGIEASGRTHYLKKAYRNTIEIFEFTQRFIGAISPIEEQMSLLPQDFAHHGDPPDIRRFESTEEIEAFLVDDISDSINKDGFKRSEIAVIYDDKVYGPSRFTYDNRALPMRILDTLNSRGIPTTWVSQDVRSKEMYDITTDRVSLISVHSSKGLDFDIVYLVGMDHIRSPGDTKDDLVSLGYVAMTRAKYRLVIPYVEETEFIKRMAQCAKGIAHGENSS
jgi:superfamily I DNA/RNA helicase